MTDARKPLLYDYPGSICCQMTRLTLAEKGVDYDKQTIDIIDKREQFEPWYTKLNPKAVVPTLAGSAWITGFAQYVVDPEDPFPNGFTVGDIWGGSQD